MIHNRGTRTAPSLAARLLAGASAPAWPERVRQWPGPKKGTPKSKHSHNAEGFWAAWPQARFIRVGSRMCQAVTAVVEISTEASRDCAIDASMHQEPKVNGLCRLSPHASGVP